MLLSNPVSDLLYMPTEPLLVAKEDANTIANVRGTIATHRHTFKITGRQLDVLS